MLSRGSSDASNLRRRSKPASSVQQRRAHPLQPQPIDPKTAQIHALVAAHRAMERSSERTSEELRRAESGASKGVYGNASRSQNVRFATAAELRRRRSTRRAESPSVTSTLNASTGYPSPTSYQYTAPTVSDFGTSENYGAQPSSYRKLRKARSMFTPQRRTLSHQQMAPQSSFSTARTLRNVNSSLGLAEHSFRLGFKKSRSFIQSPASLFKRPPAERTVPDEAIQWAREEFLQHQEQEQARPKSALSFRPRLRGQQKAFRKSVRSSRTTDFGDGIKSDNQAEIEAKPESKIRVVSLSLRDRFKRVFGKSVSTKDEFPVQQLEASRAHFREYTEGSGPDSGFDNYCTGELASRYGNHMYMPSSEEDDTLEDLDKMSKVLRSTASRESLHSNSRSRVTSWTASTKTGSLVLRSGPVEPKRLSIIKEDGGPHQPSSSAGRHFGGVTAFREPLRSENSTGQPLPPVDSQRIYSALMRRIDQEQNEMERTRAQLDSIHYEQAHHVDEEPPYPTRPTVRAVQSEGSLRTIAPDNEHRQFSLGERSWQQSPPPESQVAATAAENVARHRARLEQHEAQSSFFPFSGEGKPTTPSPFKLSLAAQREPPHGTTEEAEHDDATDTGSVIVNRPLAEHKLHGKHGMSDESLYSRTTNGGSNPAYESRSRSTDELENTGMATIIPTRVNRDHRVRPGLAHLRDVRSSERGEWKGWMETQMKSLGLDRRESRSSNRSHYRESAQIDDEDTTVGARSVPHFSRKRSERMASHIDPTLTPTAQAKPTIRPGPGMIDRFPLLDLKEVPRNMTPKPKKSSEMTRSMSGLVDKPKPNDENKRFGASSSLRKLSPKNISHLLNEKKSQVLSGMYRGTTTMTTKSESPPASTPGKLNLKMTKTRKLSDKDATAAATADQNLADMTPTQNRIRPYDDISITDSQKDLAARLSRPFDMDAPPPNRPFDSMYLGKTQDSTEAGLRGAGRLSTVPTKTAHLAMSSDGKNGEKDGTGMAKTETDTALPQMAGVDTGATRPGMGMGTGMGMGLGTKRMVSNFLRSRRRNILVQHVPEEEEARSGSSSGSNSGGESQAEAFL